MLIGSNSFLVVLKFIERIAFVIVGRHVKGIKANGLLIGNQCLLITLQPKECYAFAIIGWGIIRSTLKDALIGRQRLLMDNLCLLFAAQVFEGVSISS